MQGMRCGDIAFVALRLIPIPLLHFLFLPKLEHVCKHYFEFLYYNIPNLSFIKIYTHKYHYAKSQQTQN
jgi:hypothetical protein